MTTTERLLIPLFQQFIHDTNKGRRLKNDGKKIRPQTVENYQYVLRLLKDYEQKQKSCLRIKGITNNKRLIKSEKIYWKKFYIQFVNYLCKEKGCYDNYIGTVVRILRAFFRYLIKDKLLSVGDFYRQFYVLKEEIPVITLLPHQLQQLINDNDFPKGLPEHLKRTKQIFIFGCTVALRYCDLFAIRFSDIEKVNEVSYLSLKSIKTGTETRIKLPEYAVKIVNDFRRRAKKRKQLFPHLSINQFNKNIKIIAEQAGWTHDVRKVRSKMGKAVEVLNNHNKSYRFCDLLSSHCMRRTAVTTMLMLGMTEYVVKKISGHAENSKSFYRYVNLVQSYLDYETDKVFSKLV